MAKRDFRVWDQVPPGARLYLRLEVVGAVLARGIVSRSAEGVGVEEARLSHVQLTEGGHVLEMQEGISGTAIVTLHFPARPGSAVLSAGVVGPDGRPFKRPFRYEVEGSRGDTFRATLLLTSETLDLEHSTPG
jgi:hypothetical protein